MRTSPGFWSGSCGGSGQRRRPDALEHQQQGGDRPQHRWRGGEAPADPRAGPTAPGSIRANQSTDGCAARRWRFAARAPRRRGGRGEQAIAEGSEGRPRQGARRPGATVTSRSSSARSPPCSAPAAPGPRPPAPPYAPPKAKTTRTPRLEQPCPLRDVPQTSPGSRGNGAQSAGGGEAMVLNMCSAIASGGSP